MHVYVSQEDVVKRIGGHEPVESVEVHDEDAQKGKSEKQNAARHQEVIQVQRLSMGQDIRELPPKLSSKKLVLQIEKSGENSQGR